MRRLIDVFSIQKREAAPLVVFRFLFGLLMFFSIIRFAINGWIAKLYLIPDFHFSYLGFSWIQPLGWATYILFFLCALSALGIALGYRYLLSSVVFFLSFTYIELMDKTTYLNHYYFVSILSFIMIFLPAQCSGSLDSIRGNYRVELIPKWTINALKVFVTIVYFYAGIAKINSDWLLDAQPMTIWLSSKSNWPIVGSLFAHKITAYIFSWAGMVYDLLIPLFLWSKKYRNSAFLVVVIFHVMTRILFPIGMFPFIMIASAMLFLSDSFHKRLESLIYKFLKIDGHKKNDSPVAFSWFPWKRTLVVSVLFIQVLVPLRHVLYPGSVLWTEEGFRFSWRVMLIDKVGSAEFSVINNTDGRMVLIQNDEYLTPLQEKQMATQADFILEYAHLIRDTFMEKWETTDISVYVDSFVAFNGRRARRYISPDVDLANITASLKHKNWIVNE